MNNMFLFLSLSYITNASVTNLSSLTFTHLCCSCFILVHCLMNRYTYLIYDKYADKLVLDFSPCP